MGKCGSLIWSTWSQWIVGEGSGDDTQVSGLDNGQDVSLLQIEKQAWQDEGDLEFETNWV